MTVALLLLLRLPGATFKALSVKATPSGSALRLQVSGVPEPFVSGITFPYRFLVGLYGNIILM